MKILGAILLTLPLAAFAQGECNGHSCNDGGDTTNAVETNVETNVENGGATFSSRSRSLGVGGADYDIGSGICRYHAGGLTFAFAFRDDVCIGLSMIRAGMVEAGIRHLCLRSKIGKNYDDYASCETEVSSIRAAGPTDKTEPEAEVSQDDEDEVEQALAEQRQINVQQQQVVEDLSARLDRYERQEKSDAFAEAAARARKILEEGKR